MRSTGLKTAGFLMVWPILIEGCHHTWPPEALVPACPTPVRDTTSWVEVRAPRGRFTIRLPAGARDLGQFCIDSDCGTIAVGSWSISYDGGMMAGGGDSVPTPPDATRSSVCSETIDGRLVHIATYQFPQLPRDARWRGYFVVGATMWVARGYPLNLGVLSRSPEPPAEFLVALRTLHVEPRR